MAVLSKYNISRNFTLFLKRKKNKSKNKEYYSSAYSNLRSNHLYSIQGDASWRVPLGIQLAPSVVL